jgi:type I restriction enzyme S subunit
MKAGWQIKTLGEVCSFENGDRGENYPSKSVQTTTGVPFINAGHLTEFGLDFETMNYIPRERFNLLGNGKIRKNDILFCLRGSLGKFASVGELSEGAIASSLVIVRPKDSVIDAFVSLYFQSDLCASMIDKYKNGAAQPNLSAGSLKNFIIPVPPFPEQHRIIGILDEAFEGIAIAKANAEKNLHNARVLFESHLQAVFAVAWETGELTTLADLATDITDGDHMPPPKASSGVPFITIGNVAKDTRTIDFSDTFMVSREYFDRLKNNKKPMKGDVLYTVTGSFGIPVLISEHREFCFQRHIGLVRPKSDVCSEWLYYLLMSPQVFKQATDGATGTAQKTVSLKLLRGFQVPIVPMERQQSTVTKLNALTEETQRLASIYQQKLAALDALKKSLLDQAFRGEL